MKKFNIKALFAIGGILLLNMQSASANRDDAIFEQTLGLGLPVVKIVTVDGEEPTAETIYPPEGSLGIGITNATKVPGEVTVFSAEGDTIFNSGEYIKKESGMTIKIRGNTSAQLEKKPYKIKLQKKGDMLGRNDKSFRDKNWVLLRSNKLKTYFGNEISRLLSDSWTPSGMYVNVIFNNDYRGIYMLQESIERNSDCRIDTDGDGFIMEHDAYWWNENGEFLESVSNPYSNYTFKYPEYEDTDEQMRNAIQDILSRYELSVDNGTYPDLIDVKSFARWLLGHDILGTLDGAGANLYLVKRSISDESLIQCGPLWDFDSSEQAVDTFSQVHKSKFNSMFQNSNDSLSRSYIALWKEVKDNLHSGIDSLISDLDTPYWEAFDRSVVANNDRWDIYEESRMSSVKERVRIWYESRLEWLDDAIEKMEDNLDFPTAIDKVDLSDIIRINNKILVSDRDLPQLTITRADGRILFKGAVGAGHQINLNNYGNGLLLINNSHDSFKIII